MAEKPTVVEALSAVMAEVQAVGKGDRNSQQGYNFRGIDAVVNAVGPAFRKHGIVVVPAKTEARYRDVTTSTGKPSRECTVIVTYRFHGPAGDFIDCEVPGESMDFGDKGAPKAMSVAYRIALLQALCIPTDEPDPDSQSYERASHGEDWTPAPVPTPEQAAKFAELLKAVNMAADEPALLEHGSSVRAASKAGDITPNQYDQLARRASARLAEMRTRPLAEVVAEQADQ